MPFVSTENKNVIRKYDGKIIRRESKRKGKRFIYFGLPGWELLDVLEWKRFLSKIIAVERNMLTAHKLLNTAFSHGLDARFQLLLGDIDEILITGKDMYDQTPKEPTFDLVNLDYEGGIMYKNLKGESKRVNAIKKLLERQSIGKHDFLLLTTFNTRNRDEKEFNRTLEGIREQLDSYGIDAEEIVRWYQEKARYDFKVKIFYPYFLERLSAISRFTCKFYPPITYKGTSNIRMIHFVCALKYNPGRVIVGERSLLGLLNLPMFEVSKGVIYKCDLPSLQLGGVL